MQRLAEQLDSFVLTMRAAISPPREGLSLTAAATLARLEREGPARLTELAVAEGVSQPAMTALIGRLAERGLVRREADPGDGRAVVLTLTGDGATYLGQRRRERAARLAGPLDDLSADDRRTIAAALPALTRLAESARASSQRPDRRPRAAR